MEHTLETRRISLYTPELIEVEFEIAGIGSRFAGVAWDHLFQVGLIAIAWILTQGLSMVTGAGVMGMGDSPMWLQAVFGVAVFIIMFGYFPFFEIRWDGQTPGKRRVGTRTVKTNGQAIDATASIIRSLLRIVDFALPPPYGAGVVSIFFSKRYQRLGDIAAGTIVIRDRPESAEVVPPRKMLSAISKSMLPLLVPIRSLTQEELEAVRLFAVRSHDLTMDAQIQVAAPLAKVLLRRLSLEMVLQSPAHAVDLLIALYYHQMNPPPAPPQIAEPTLQSTVSFDQTADPTIGIPPAPA